ncbi:MAG: ADP-ribosylation factor-like protein, partial [Candidatus Odinarchaeota archaeon]
MSTWISESELASRLGYKILIAGLSEAGKTAVKRIFFMKQQTGDVDKLAATINYERMAVSIKGVPITIVDLGGQRVFIRRFLSKFSPFVFSNVQVFIFVIDVSEKSTRNNSIQYFTNCVEKLKQYSPEARIFVFLHKNDLVRALPNYESIHIQLKEQFQLESPKKIGFLRTTIYRPGSVIDAFGRIFELAMPEIANSDYVDGRTIGQIEEYAEKFFTVEMQDEICPNCLTTLVENNDQLVCNFCGFQRGLQRIPATISATAVDNSSATLENLKTLMKESVTSEEVESATSLPPSPPATPQHITTADKGVTSSPGLTSSGPASQIGEEELKSLLKGSLIKDHTTRAISGQPSATVPGEASDSPYDVEKLKSLMQASLIEDQPGKVGLSTTPSVTDHPATRLSPRPLTHLSEEVTEEKEVEMALTSASTTDPEGYVTDEEAFLASSTDLQISFLETFYGIKAKEAEKLVKTGNDGVFETVAK